MHTTWIQRIKHQQSNTTKSQHRSNQESKNKFGNDKTRLIMMRSPQTCKKSGTWEPSSRIFFRNFSKVGFYIEKMINIAFHKTT